MFRADPKNATPNQALKWLAAGLILIAAPTASATLSSTPPWLEYEAQTGSTPGRLRCFSGGREVSVLEPIYRAWTADDTVRPMPNDGCGWEPLDTGAARASSGSDDAQVAAVPAPVETRAVEVRDLPDSAPPPSVEESGPAPLPPEAVQAALGNLELEVSGPHTPPEAGADSVPERVEVAYAADGSPESEAIDRPIAVANLPERDDAAAETAAEADASFLHHTDLGSLPSELDPAVLTERYAGRRLVMPTIDQESRNDEEPAAGVDAGNSGDDTEETVAALPGNDDSDGPPPAVANESAVLAERYAGRRLVMPTIDQGSRDDEEPVVEDSGPSSGDVTEETVAALPDTGDSDGPQAVVTNDPESSALLEAAQARYAGRRLVLPPTASSSGEQPVVAGSDRAVEAPIQVALLPLRNDASAPEVPEPGDRTWVSDIEIVPLDDQSASPVSETAQAVEPSEPAQAPSAADPAAIAGEDIALSTAPIPALTSEAAASPDLEPAAPVDASSASASQETVPEAAATHESASQESPETEGPEAAAVAAPRAVDEARSDPVWVQLVSVPENIDAQEEWRRLQTAYRTILGELDPRIIRADLGDRGIYQRIRIGPFERSEAVVIRDGLGEAGLSTLIYEG